MELLANLFNVSPEERRIVHRMANFIALFYAKFTNFYVFTPIDDFHFLKAMIWCKEEYLQIGKAVIASINRHLW